MLIRYWQPILAAIAALGFAFMLHSCSIDRLEKKHVEDLAKQEAKINTECQAAKLATYGVSDDYQKNLSAIGGRLSSVLLRTSSETKCVPVSVAAAGRDAGQPESPVVHRSNGVNARALFELAADADRERAQRRACQAYVRAVRSALGQ